MKNEQPPYYPPYYPEQDADEDSIDLIALAKKIWAGRKTILITIVVGMVLGVAVALLTPKEYSVSTIMIPQVGNKSSAGGLSSLAALAGIDLSSATSSSDISPLIYPQIIGSTPFKLELMNTKFNFKALPQPVSLFDYYNEYQKTSVIAAIKKYTIGLPGLIMKALKGNKKDSIGIKDKSSLILMSKDQNEICKLLDELIVLDVDTKQGYLTLTVNMGDPLVAAQVAQKAQEFLQREIIRFKVQKAQADLDFIQERYDEIKAKAEGYQVGIAKKNDQYKNLVSTVPQVQTTRLQTQYGIASSVFQEVAKQLEQAKIQVKRDTPVFTIIQPVTVPLESAKPNKPLTVIIFIFLGGIVGIGLVFGKHFLSELKEKWNENEEVES